jgi:hypothetical protein
MSQKWVYFFADGEQRRGPLPLEELRNFPLQPQTLVWREGLQEWTALKNVPELWAIFAEKFSTPAAEYETNAQGPVQGKVAPGFGVPQTGFLRDETGTLAYDTPNPGQTASGMAIASMVLGIVSMVIWCVPLLSILSIPCAILAIIFGFIARGKVKRKEAGGGGLALAGLILGFVNVGLMAVFILMFAGIMFFAANAPNTAMPATPIPATGPIMRDYAEPTENPKPATAPGN